MSTGEVLVIVVVVSVITWTMCLMGAIESLAEALVVGSIAVAIGMLDWLVCKELSRR